MAIKDGDLISANPLLNLVGITFKNQAQLLYNAARIGFNSKLNVATGVPNLKNIKYDACLTDTATKTRWSYDATNKNYIGQGIDDEIDDSSYAHHWTASTNPGTYTTSTVTENTDYLQCATSTAGSTASWGVNATATAKSNGTTPINYYNSNRNSHITARIYNYATSDQFNSSYTKFGLTDGSNTVYLKTYSSSYNTVTDDSVWDIYIDAGANTVDLYNDGVLDTADIDISSLGTNYYFILESYSYKANTSTGSSSNIKLYYLYSIMAGETNSLIFQTTGLGTVTDCIATWNALIDSDNTLAVSISADGTNYETVTDATIHRFTNTGTNLYIKFIVTRVDITAVDKISEYAILYNTGAA